MTDRYIILATCKLERVCLSAHCHIIGASQVGPASIYVFIVHIIHIPALLALPKLVLVHQYVQDYLNYLMDWICNNHKYGQRQYISMGQDVHLSV